MLLSCVNQKGGTGKSTVATNLAACFAGDGKEVLLVDSDQQGTCIEWKAERPGDRPAVQTVALPVDNLHKEVAGFKKKYEVIIIDSGGRITSTARAAVIVADFVIVPTLPSRPDISSTEGFFTEVIAEASQRKPVQAAILLNQVQTGTVIARKSQEYLHGLQYAVFDTVLHQYVAFREAIGFGLSVVEYEPGGKAAQEMQAFFTELKEVLHG